jgi:sialidase-1
MAVQLSDGGIMLNMRTRVNRSDSSAFNGRAISVTYDMGETWSVHPGSGISLIEPACMASLHKHENPPGTSRRDILFFSNPSSGTARIDMTIKASLDDGTSWPKEYWLLLDDMKSRGYSCLTSVDARTLGILYESSQADLVFQKIALSTWPGLRLP